mgnify:CR=1 FL=1
MPVTVICVGKLRERFFADAAAEYLKRLRRLMPVTVIEVPDEPEPVQPGDAQNEVVLRREGERILARLTDRDHVIALCVDAKQYESPELAARLEGLSEIGIFFRMFVPIMRSTYGAAMTVTFMNAWNSYLWPKIVFQSNASITMPMLVANLKSGYSVDYGMLMLGVLICTLPTAIIFLCLQKSFANGITGAVK